MAAKGQTAWLFLKPTKDQDFLLKNCALVQNFPAKVSTEKIYLWGNQFPSLKHPSQTGIQICAEPQFPYKTLTKELRAVRWFKTASLISPYWGLIKLFKGNQWVINPYYDLISRGGTLRWGGRLTSQKSFGRFLPCLCRSPICSLGSWENTWPYILSK